MKKIYTASILLTILMGFSNVFANEENLETFAKSTSASIDFRGYEFEGREGMKTLLPHSQVGDNFPRNGLIKKGVSSAVDGHFTWEMLSDLKIESEQMTDSCSLNTYGEFAGFYISDCRIFGFRSMSELKKTTKAQIEDVKSILMCRDRSKPKVWNQSLEIELKVGVKYLCQMFDIEYVDNLSFWVIHKRLLYKIDQKLGENPNHPMTKEAKWMSKFEYYKLFLELCPDPQLTFLSFDNKSQELIMSRYLSGQCYLFGSKSYGLMREFIGVKKTRLELVNELQDLIKNNFFLICLMRKDPIYSHYIEAKIEQSAPLVISSHIALANLGLMPSSQEYQVDEKSSQNFNELMFECLNYLIYGGSVNYMQINRFEDASEEIFAFKSFNDFCREVYLQANILLNKLDMNEAICIEAIDLNKSTLSYGLNRILESEKSNETQKKSQLLLLINQNLLSFVMMFNDEEYTTLIDRLIQFFPELEQKHSPFKYDL